jgi:hypothetical protein
MKKYFIYTIALAASLFLLSCSDNSSVVESNSASYDNASLSKGSSGPSANGQGVLTFEDQKQTFSFHAREKNGVVTGSVQVNARNLPDGKAHGRIDCMIIDGNVATISGQFTGNGIDFGDGIGRTYFVFQVQDNGEGSKNPKDGFSDVFVLLTDAFPCDAVAGSDLIGYEIVNGNFQVKQ